MNLVSKTVASSPTVQSSSASNCLGTPKALGQSLCLTGRARKPAGKDSNQNDAASSSQVRQSDVKRNLSAGRSAAGETNQNLDLSARAGTPAAQGSNIVDVDSEWTNSNPISAASVRHLEKAY